MAYKTIQLQDDEKSKLVKRLYKRNKKSELKLRRKKDYNYNIPLYQESIIAATPGFYPMYSIISDWAPLPVQYPVLTCPVPILINPITPIPSPIFQYYTPVPPLAIPPVPCIPLDPPPNLSPAPSLDNSIDLNLNTELETFEVSQDLKEHCNDPLESYLNLPKELFPSARMLALNPNEIIDVFCKETDLENHVSWILDLEFGIPKSPITRPIPFYNIKLNSINCKNTPEAIHPGFETCNEDFKNILLFYYDCVISSWYRGYVLLNCDKSVENFQTWLLVAMQELGMCWP